MPKVQLTVSPELLEELDREREIEGGNNSRSAFLRRIVQRAVLQSQRERWEEQDEQGYAEHPDSEPDPDEFVHWPGYGAEENDERIARIRKF